VQPDDTTSSSVDETEVVDIVSTGISDDDGGLVAETEEIMVIIAEECGQRKDETFNETWSLGSRTVSVDYSVDARAMCNDNGEKIYVEYQVSSLREAQLLRLDVVSETQSSWNLSSPEGSELILAGSYNYQGEEVFKIGRQNTFNTELFYSSENLVINENGDFLSGELYMEYSILSTTGESVEGTGSLVIISTNIGLLTADRLDNQYEINLKTGEHSIVE
jgi:hypothetical protein